MCNSSNTIIDFNNIILSKLKRNKPIRQTKKVIAFKFPIYMENLLHRHL